MFWNESEEWVDKYLFFKKKFAMYWEIEVYLGWGNCDKNVIKERNLSGQFSEIRSKPLLFFWQEWAEIERNKTVRNGGTWEENRQKFGKIWTE